jgi:transcriptional regulator of arginine metabolism
MSDSKNHRHSIIKQLILTRHVRTQEELADALERRKIEVTQATLSRDLAELGVSRVHTNAGFHYALPQGGTVELLRELVSAQILSVESNETLVVVRTLIGHAHAVGVYLDGLGDKDILGTIAGDDTVMIIPSSIKKTKLVAERIRSSIS